MSVEFSDPRILGSSSLEKSEVICLDIFSIIKMKVLEYEST